jgi:hypothetical protein
VSAAVHYFEPGAENTRCNRVVFRYALVTSDVAEVTCRWCSRELDRDFARAPSPRESGTTPSNEER